MTNTVSKSKDVNICKCKYDKDGKIMGLCLRCFKMEYKAEKRGEENERDKCKFNTDEIYKEWLDNFYEDDWTFNTMKLTDFEKQIIGELTTFLPRHMAPYDWNLPFAEAIILIIRNLLKGRKIITDDSLTHQKG